MIAEGVIRFQCAHRDAALPEAARERLGTLLAWRRLLRQLEVLGRDAVRYDGAAFGNLSARITPYPGERGRRRFVITGSQTAGQERAGAESFSVVDAYDAKRNWVRSEGPALPSSESMTHGTLYDLDPRVRFVFHGHARELWQKREPMGLPATAPRIAYGTPEMAFDVARLFRESRLAELGILAMGGHEDGIVTFGHTAEAAGEVLLRYLARAYAGSAL